jgi:antitoxin component of RelBE/YafQ-DinJ toxin-antitoxin module
MKSKKLKDVVTFRVDKKVKRTIKQRARELRLTPSRYCEKIMTLAVKESASAANG